MNSNSNNSKSFTKRSRTSGTTMTNTVGGFPDHARVRLRYVDNVSRTPTSTTVGQYVFRGNGCFDPDVTSTGAQPANWDDWSAQYQRYRVWGSKITWVLANDATGSGDFCTFVMGPRHTTANVNTQALQESMQAQPYTKWGKSIIYNNGDPLSLNRGSISMTTEKFLGLTRAEFLGNDDLTSLTSADPTHQWYWYLTFCADDQTSTFVMYINVTIEYDVEFWDRVDTSLDLKYERLLRNRRLKAASDALQQQEASQDEESDGVLVQSREQKHRLKAAPPPPLDVGGLGDADNPRRGDRPPATTLILVDNAVAMTTPVQASRQHRQVRGQS